MLELGEPFTQIVDTLGDRVEPPPEVVASAKLVRQALAQWLQVEAVESGPQHQVVREVAKRRKEPDIDVPTGWRGGRREGLRIR